MTENKKNSLSGNLELRSDFNLYSCDWESLEHGFNIFMVMHGWSSYRRRGLYTNSGGDKLKISFFKCGKGYDVYVHGTLSVSYELIEDILEWISGRFVTVNGRILVDIMDTPNVEVLSIKKNHLSVKPGTF